jgi:hypothetical protein
LPKRDANPGYGVLNVEKRKHPRFTVLLPIEFYRINSSAGSATRALDISEGGLLLNLSEQMDIGQLLRLKLFLSMAPTPDVIELISEVVWVQAHIRGMRWLSYRTGVKLLEASPNHLADLKSFLTTLSEPNH